MSRAVDTGSEFTAKNNYTYRKVDDKWVLKHHIIAGEYRGKPIDKATERVTFVDNDRQNLDPSNLRVSPKGTKDPIKSRERRIATLQDKIRELTAELHDLELEVSDLKKSQ